MADFSITLRGRKCTVDGTLTAADPDVGLSDGIEEFTVTDDESGIVIIDLTDEEETAVQHRSAEFAADYYSDDGWD